MMFQTLKVNENSKNWSRIKRKNEREEKMSILPLTLHETFWFSWKCISVPSSIFKKFVHTDFTVQVHIGIKIK